MDANDVDDCPGQREAPDRVRVVEIGFLGAADGEGPVERWEGWRDVGEGLGVDLDFEKCVAGLMLVLCNTCCTLRELVV